MGIKYPVNEKFFQRWSHKMAYVLGYLYADGSMENALYLRGLYVRVSSIDKETIEKIRGWMESKHSILEIIPNQHNIHRKTKYLLRIGSHELYHSLTKLGLYPNKSLTVKLPIVPRGYFGDFLRGYFDGDGCVFVEKKITRKNILRPKRLLTVFTSGSFDFLKTLASTLQENHGVSLNKVYDSRRSFQLRYSTRDSERIFVLMYKNRGDNIFLRRKYEIFKRYFSSITRKIPKNVVKIM